MSDELVFTLFYIIFTVCVVYPPVEFISAGFTIPILFSRFLGSEDEDFIGYHTRRIVVTLIIYSILPLGYVLALYTTDYLVNVGSLFESSIFWKVFYTSSIALPILSIILVIYWMNDNYRNHPVAVNLSKFCNNNNRDWRSVAADINIEFRRIDKISIRTNTLIKVIATENWILKITPFTILVAHQSDTNLVVKHADTHQISLQTATEIQYLTIEVKSTRQNVDNFTIRINAADFRDLEDRICRDIAILPNVKFHKNVMEQFIDVFKETIKSNPKYETTDGSDQCIGCMQARPNIKLQKLCIDDDTVDNKCTTCFCKPLWCVDCMARWFASRQEVDRQNTWLSSKCTCPMCRSKFCVLDVSLIDIDEPVT